MKEFKTFLEESLNNPYKWTLTKRNSFVIGEFVDLDNEPFAVAFKQSYKDSWQCIFGNLDENEEINFENTGKGDSKKILSTVLSIIEYFLESYQPKNLSFTGDNNNGKAKLYNKILEHFISKLEKLGYEKSFEKSDKFSKFEITIKPPEHNPSIFWIVRHGGYPDHPRFLIYSVDPKNDENVNSYQYETSINISNSYILVTKHEWNKKLPKTLELTVEAKKRALSIIGKWIHTDQAKSLLKGEINSIKITI